MLNKQVILSIILVVVVVVEVGFIAKGFMDCHSSGGAYVRSLLWFSCIE